MWTAVEKPCKIKTVEVLRLDRVTNGAQTEAGSRGWPLPLSVGRGRVLTPTRTLFLTPNNCSADAFAVSLRMGTHWGRRELVDFTIPERS